MRKKDGMLPFCTDLRNLSNMTIKDAYSLQGIQETLKCLKWSDWFRSLDLKLGYWQVHLSENSKDLTPFTVGPLGLYECKCMPFGLTNMPATFQCLMESCLGDLQLQWCIIYLDDIIIFVVTPKEHIKQLQAVLEKTLATDLKLKPSKCDFFQVKLGYLGHIVSKDDICTDERKIEARWKWSVPQTVMEMHSFLGFSNYY